MQQLTRIQAGLTIFLLAALAATGCQSTPVISAAALPDHYRAQNAAHKPPIDLSVLAQRSMNSKLVYPGDSLKVVIASGAEEQPVEPISYWVGPEGQLKLPHNVVVDVNRVPLTEVERIVQEAYVRQRIFRNPNISVQLEARQTDRIRVVGAVKNPGSYDLPVASSDLLTAISEAGGLAEEAGTTIEIRHPVLQSSTALVGYSDVPQPAGAVHVDLVAAMTGEQQQDLTLRDGSVVMVRKQEPQTIYVHGLVLKDGEYELPADQPLRVTQAIALAGGRELEIADKVHVTRFIEGREEPIVIEVSVKEAKSNQAANLILAPRDTVSVEQTPTVFVVDFARNFFRFGFSSALF